MKYLLATILSLTIMQITLPKKDKVFHFGAGYIITHAAYSIIPEYTDNKKVIKYGPIILCLASGVAKELVDKYDSDPKSTFEWADIAYTSGGGFTFISIKIKIN